MAKKKKHLIGPKEFLFNFLSLVFMIGIGIYFGYRSLYYYSLQSAKKIEEANTLNGLVIQQNAVVQGDSDGFHQDDEGYYFKGNVSNNYVYIRNKIFRIIRIYSDNTIKLISEDYAASFMWGESSAYKGSNVHNWLVKTDLEHSGVYQNTFSSPSDFLVKTAYQEDILASDKVLFADQQFKDYFTLLGINDYVMANGRNSFLNTGDLFFLLGHDEDGNNLFVDEDGSIQSCESLSGYGIRPVITLKKNLTVSGGDGSPESPYVIALDIPTNYVDSYVRLGNDLWRVFENQDGILRLYLNDYIKINGEELFYRYSDTSSIFDLTDITSLAYYLNTSYYWSLPYASILLDHDYYTGEVSDDVGYSYQNIYLNKVTCKVALLNIFDYNCSGDLSDYFYMNTTSQVGTMQYNRDSKGLLKEADVWEAKHVVPVISISKNSISKGMGTMDNPYVVE